MQAPTKSNAILWRLGPAPHAGGRKSVGCHGCPDLFELASGDFLAIGKDVSLEMAASLPADAGCAQDERIILIPRRTLVEARKEIPVTL